MKKIRISLLLFLSVFSLKGDWSSRADEQVVGESLFVPSDKDLMKLYCGKRELGEAEAKNGNQASPAVQGEKSFTH